MFCRTPLSILALAAVYVSTVALAQETAYGKWVTDPNNQETAVFAYGPPPAGFNPLTATDVELEQLGYPPRPDRTEARRYSRWKKMVTAKRITPELKPAARYSSLPRGLKVIAAEGSVELSSSKNWSGFAFTAPVGTFAANDSEIDAEWTVPAAQQAPGVCSSTSDYSSQWIGFDGAAESDSSDVLQSGTEADAYCIGGVTVATYYAWVEWFPAGSMQVTNFAVNPGDGIQLSVSYTTASPQGHATFMNEATNQSVSMAFNKPRSPRYAGSSVEWIMERPTIDGALPDLSNYGFFGFNDGAAYNASATSYTPGSNPSGTTSWEITMVCPPWNPSTACGRRGSNISTFNLNVGNEGENTLWFTANPPAGP
jgi:hypothetical protein